MATIRVTILRAGVTDAYGIAMAVGTTYTPEFEFGKSLIMSLAASDTDGIFSSAALQKSGNDQQQRQSSAPESLTVSRTLSNLDNGKSFKSVDAAITVTVPTGLASDFAAMFQQGGASQITFVGATNAAGTSLVTINNASTQLKTSGQYAVVTLVRDDPIAEIYVLAGSTGA